MLFCVIFTLSLNQRKIMRRIFIFSICLLFLNTLFAQQQVFLKEYYFTTGSATLSPADQSDLNELIKDLNPEQSQVSIKGYSDHTGSQSRNMELSQERAQAVKSFFETNGWTQSIDECEGFGNQFLKYNKTSTLESDKNRRVAIQITVTPIVEKKEETVSTIEKDTNTIVLEEPKKPLIESKAYRQEFNIDKKEGTTITGSQGTVLTIPDNAFKVPAKLRKENPDEDIKIELVEYYDKSDLVLNNFTTQLEDGTIIESGGTVDIRATYAGEPVDLKGNKKIAMDFPTDNYKEGMTDWYGRTAEDSSIVWSSDALDLNGKSKKKKKIMKTIIIAAVAVAAVVTVAIIASNSSSGSSSSSSDAGDAVSSTPSRSSTSSSTTRSTTSSSGSTSRGVVETTRPTTTRGPIRTSGTTPSTRTTTPIFNGSGSGSSSTTPRTTSNTSTSQDNYRIESRSTGQVNCDRLLTFTRSETTRMVVKDYNRDSDVKLVFKNRNVVLQGKRDGDKVYFLDVPRNEEVYVVAVDKGESTSNLCIKESNTSALKRVKTDYKTVKNERLKTELAVMD